MSKGLSKVWAAGVLAAILVASASLIINLSSLYEPRESLTCTTTLTVTQTYTATSTVTTTQTYTTTTLTTTTGEPFVRIISSEGSCGGLESPSLSFERRGEYVLLTYAESAGVPCFRQIIEDVLILERYPPLVKITLRLQPTSDGCILCTGVVETVLEVGPVPTGTEIVVNGLRVQV